MKFLVVGIALGVLASCSARTVRQTQRGHFIGDGSNDVTASILQDLVPKKGNAVFSPLGYTTVLAVLTEGARGNTRNQLTSALRLPEDTYAVRSTYKRILSDMSEREAVGKPQFNNWFYVYKNYTVEETYKQVLKENYLIDVRQVANDYGEDDTTEKSIDSEKIPEQQNSLVNENNNNQKPDSDEADSEESKEKNDSKENNSKEKDSKESASKEEDSSEEKKKGSEKKPSNVMKIKEKEVIKETPVLFEDKTEKVEKVPETTNSPVVSDEVEKVVEDNSSKAPEMTTAFPEASTFVPEQETVTKVSTAEPEKIVTVEDGVKTKRDVASALSANRLSSLDFERESSLRKLSRMITFNALYFKANWTKRFNLNTEKKPFHVTPNETVMVEMLNAEDEFPIGQVPELNSWVLDLPYEGDRYSLMILVPVEANNGLEDLAKKLTGFSFYNIDKHLTKLPTKVCIPKLRFNTISKPKAVFQKKGIVDLFNEDADLSGISGNKGLYLEELVQFVTFEVEESHSSYNYLTSTDISEVRSTVIPFTADEPFIFLLRDRVENLTLVAGMVNNPNASSDL